MALTGDLAQLHIADIIQLIHTTRQSGMFSVMGTKGESRIIFSNGYIVGANHLNSRIRIGSVLVTMKVISQADLKSALDMQKRAGSDRKPLINTLKQLGKLKDEDAFRGLRKLIEITVIELINWKEGTFTFDTDAISVSPECCYSPGEMDQDLSLDAQMVLMDAMRIYDERERDLLSGKQVQTYEELFTEALPSEGPSEPASKAAEITADILGLADLDQLENRQRRPVQISEVFDPIAIQRNKVQKLLADFPAEQQEEFMAFLNKAVDRTVIDSGSERTENQSRTIVLFSADELLMHVLMTICKNDGIIIFPVSREGELDRVMEQCLTMKLVPVMIFDMSGDAGNGLSDEDTTALRLRFRSQYPQIPVLQLINSDDCSDAIQSYRDGIRAAFPRPSRTSGSATFIKDIIIFIEAFRAYIRNLLCDHDFFAVADIMKILKDRVMALRGREELGEVSSSVLDAVAMMFVRAITFQVRGQELVCDNFAGVSPEAAQSTMSALRLPLGSYSVFDEVIETGQLFFGASDDELLHNDLFDKIGAPFRSSVLVLPIKCSGQVRALIYGDFGNKESSPVAVDLLDILAQEAGLVLENALYRAEILKSVKGQ